jgi:hypothetical protein
MKGMDMKRFSGHGAAASHAGRMAFPHLGELLVSGGVLPAEAVGRVMARQRELGVPFGEAAVDLGLVSQADVQVALAHQFDYPVLPVGDQGVSPSWWRPSNPTPGASRPCASCAASWCCGAANPQLNTVAVVGAGGRGPQLAGRQPGRAVLPAGRADPADRLRPALPRQQSLFRLAPAGGLASRLAERGEKGAILPHRALRSCRCCRPASCRPTPGAAGPPGLRRRWRWPATPST